MTIVGKIYALILYAVGGVIDLLQSFVVMNGVSLANIILASIFVGIIFSFLRGGSND